MSIAPTETRDLCAEGRALRRSGRYAAAEELLVRALAIAENDPPRYVEAANELGVLYKYTARFDEAESLYRGALRHVAIDSLEAATLWHNLGGLEHSRGRFELAEPAARRAVEIRTRILGHDHPAVAEDRAALGAILDALGRLDEAETLLAATLETWRRLYGSNHWEVAIAANNLAALCFRRGDLTQAGELWEQALRIKRNLLGSTHPELAPTLANLGVLTATRGDAAAARSLFADAIDVLGPEVRADHPVRRAVAASIKALPRAGA
jgi:tetratricopeptide (TPR) repeat protein